MTAVWPLLLGLAAGAATLAGGVLTLRARGRLHLVTGASAGIVLGVALLDLLPEALGLAQGQGSGGWPVLAAAALAFGAYVGVGALLERMERRGRWLRRQLGPASLTTHSLMDGASIGLAFQVSPQLGWGVALAVLGHDLADGVNIVGLTLARGDRRAARLWLAANALAPLAGAAIGRVLVLPERALVLSLGTLAGVFLAIAMGELLPRSLRLGRIGTTSAAAALGFLAVLLVTHLRG